MTDVLQLLSLVVARDLLRDAGAGQPWYDASRTGVVLGVTGANQLTQPLSARLQTPVVKEVVRSCGLSARDAEEIAEKFKLAFAPWEENSFPGMLGNVVAGRVANRLDLGGTNMTIDAACASSLGAAKAAISELLERRADMMLTGGCDAENTIFMYLCFSKTPAFSKSGSIRPFDKAADGTLIGEGIGMLALRRLADAERDGNRVYAVIRGIGSSSDGRFKSIYAPRKEGQTVALRRAYHDAGCSPDSVELFEAHGTGTAVGDATELSALAEVVGSEADSRQFAAIGSVKSQIGHTKAAAGAAGLIKLALALHHRLLPPTINVAEPNPAIDFDNSPFYVNTVARPWIRHPRRPERRAALSSFGFGGTNFHVVLQEHGEGGRAGILSPTARVYLWHAPDAMALARQLAEGAPPAADPVPAGHARLAFAADSEESAARLRELARETLLARPDAEQWDHPKGIAFRGRAAGTGKVGALFAGQGSQYVNAGRTALLSVPVLRQAFDEANQYFDGERPLSAVAFPRPAFDDATREGQETALRHTAYAQPAIGALSAGQYRYLRELGFHADGFLGHSFGELTALWAAGALGDDAFFRLARARGAAMAPPERADFDPGAMAAVTASASQAEHLLTAAPGLAVCNHNAPDQIVIGGPTGSVERLLAAAGASGVRATRVPVAAAFHTPLVAHAVEAFERSVAEAGLGVPRQPVFANTPGATYGGDPAANRAVLAGQLVKPVAFADRVAEMYALGFRTFVEFGPRGVLGGLVARILRGQPHAVVSLDPGPGKDADLGLKAAIARLAVLGLPLSTGEPYAEPVVPEPPATGMTIGLNGINYVSPARRAAYREALENGYQVPTTPPPAPSGRPAAPAPVPAPAPVAAGTRPVPVPAAGSAPAPAVARVDTAPAPAPAAPQLDRSTMTHDVDPPLVPAAGNTGVVADHLSLHDQYLTGQLESAHLLAGILAKAADEGRVDDVIAGVTAVKEHGLAISRTHQRAHEVLRELATLEYGAHPAAPQAEPFEAARAEPVQGARTEPAAVVAAQPTALPVALPKPVQLDPEPGPPAPEPVPVASAGVDVGAVREALLAVVAEKTGYPAEMLELGMDVEADLGIDSIKRVEILGSLQAAFPRGGSVGPEQLAELRTLGDIAGFLAGAAGEAAGGVEPVPVASAGVDVGAVREALLAVVAEKTGYPAEMLELGMDVEADLGIDSIKRVEILGSLQAAFPRGGSVGPEQLAELRTLGDIAGFLAGAAGATGATGATGEADAAAVPSPQAPGVPSKAPSGVGRAQASLAELPPPDQMVDAFPQNAAALLVDDGSDLVAPVARGLAADGWQIHVLRLPEVPQRVTEGKDRELSGWNVTELANQLTEVARERLHLVVTFAAHDGATWKHNVRWLAHSLLVAKHTVPALTRAAGAGRAAFLAVTRLDGTFGLGGVEEDLVPRGGYPGLVKTLAIEAPEVFCRSVDLGRDLDPEEAAHALLAELRDAAPSPPQVGIGAGKRLALTLAGTPLPAPEEAAPPAEPGSADLFVVTGGGRGITATCAVRLAERYRVRLLLLGRTPLADEPAWAAGVEGDAALKQKAAAYLGQQGEKPTPKRVEQLYRTVAGQREIRETVAAVEAAGGWAGYVSVDITDAAAVGAALAPYAQEITGLVHGAGVLADQLIERKKSSEIERVFAPKLEGLRSVVAALPAERLRHVVLFSSVAGFFGNRGQSDYAMANEVLNTWASSFKRRHPSARVTSLNWGAWDSGMVSPQMKEVFAERGIGLVGSAEGAGLFTEQFAAERAADTVTVLGPTTPLSAPAAGGHRAVVVEGSLAELAAEPIVRDHVIGEAPVLPAAVALGWAIGAAERVTGRTATGVRAFTVHKGLVFDGGERDRFLLELVPAADGSTTSATVRSVGEGAGPRPRYACDVVLAPRRDAVRQAPVLTGLPPLDAGREAGFYADGTLFHGPALRGITRVLEDAGDRLVLAGALRRLRPANGTYSSPLHDPGTADLLLQAALVWARLKRGTAALPLGIERADLYEALPDGSPFLLVAEPVTAEAEIVKLTVTACSPEGRVLTRFTGISVVSAPRLAAKFAGR